MKRRAPFLIPASPAEISRQWLLRQWRAEQDSAALYAALAQSESDAEQRRLYGELAASERRHAALWEKRLRAAGHTPLRHRPSLHTRLLIQLARRFGARFVAPAITVREMKDRDHYASLGDSEALGLAYDEQNHAAIMRTRAPGAFGNNLRAAVLGANDGVASNFCLMMGVAGGGAHGPIILLSGLSGLVGGACAMALGEWLSVTNARELALSQMEREIATGGPASRTARKDPAREDPARRGPLPADVSPPGDARSAAAFSFCLFALGAAVPLLSFCALSGAAAVAGSIAASLAALFALGLATSLFNGRSAIFSGARQAAIGAGAAAVTFLAGRLFDALHSTGL